jgi:hypothetical protein
MTGSGGKEGEADMTAAVKKIRSYSLPPDVLRVLGLEKDWNQSVPEELIESVARTVKKYRRVIDALAKK